MTSDQVRWKMNALLKKYKQIVDNYSKSGRGNIEFEWFQQMDDILRKRKDSANPNYTVSSNTLSTDTEKPSTFKQFGKKRFSESSHSSTNKPFEKEGSNESSDKSQNSTNVSISVNATGNNLKQKNRPTHGTGSKIAKTKIELEKQWLERLAVKKERDRIKGEKYSTLIESKKEAVKLKKSNMH